MMMQPPVVLVRHAYRLWPSSIYGLYEHGVSQMKDQVGGAEGGRRERGGHQLVA